MGGFSVSFRDVWRAKKRIAGIINQTPLIYSEPLSKRTEANIYLKLEQNHPTGAFKLRGAANKILSLEEEAQQKGVTTFSTGNHGIAVAYVAAELGIPCTVCISNRVPAAKVNRLKKLKAVVEKVGSSQDDAADRCRQLEIEKEMTIIKPFDDKEVIAGQGTIALEIIEQCPDIDEVIIPLSGGGLLSGIAFVMKSIDSSTRITGVTMKNSAVMLESLGHGKPVRLVEEDTLADSLLGGIGLDNQFTFSMTKKYMDEGILVEEKEIENGLLFLMEHHKMIVEGAAAIGVGHVLRNEGKIQRNTAIIVTGNNIDHEVITGLLKQS